MSKIFLTLLLACCSLTAAAGDTDKVKSTDDNLLKAALRGWQVRLGAGFNLGGTSPLPLPAEIRKIESYQPGLCFMLQGAAHKRIGTDRKWGVMFGLRFESKGMKTDATVKNYHMEAVNDDGSGTVRGAWTGKVKTEVSSTYLTMPILATYDISKRWMVKAGPYFSYMVHGTFKGSAYDGYIRDIDPTGPKTEVQSASYDFSDDLRRFQWGVQAGGEFKAYEHLSVSLDLSWGLNVIFPRDFGSVTFALYPIYGTLGFHYLF